MSLILLLGAACGGSDDEGPDSLDLDTIISKRGMAEGRVDSLIGDPSCTSDPECVSIAFGVKPCGGPWEYKVYSTSITDTAELQAAVSDYNYYDSLYNSETGEPSDCMFVLEPTTTCLAGHCQVNPAG